MASEDSDQFSSGLAVVHRLCDLCDLDQAVGRQVAPGGADLDARRELLEVALLRGSKRIRAEERNDHFQEGVPPADVVAPQMLLVVVVSTVEEQPSDTEELTELLEATLTALALNHAEAVRYLVAGCVAAPTVSVGLLRKADGEATLPIDKTDDPFRADWSFLLIFRTARIVTAHDMSLGPVPADTRVFQHIAGSNP